MKPWNDTYDGVGTLALVDWVRVFGSGVEVFTLVARVFGAAELELTAVQVGCIIFEEELAAFCEGVPVEALTGFGVNSAAVERVFAVHGEVVVPCWWTVAVGGAPVRPAKEDARAQSNG